MILCKNWDKTVSDENAHRRVMKYLNTFDGRCWKNQLLQTIIWKKRKKICESYETFKWKNASHGELFTWNEILESLKLTEI